MGLPQAGTSAAVRRPQHPYPDGCTARENIEALCGQGSFSEHGALAVAATLEIDAVIDPADTRAWLLRGRAAGRVREAGPRFMDTR